MQPIITIFCPFTRRWAIDQWVANLENVEYDPAQTHLAFIIDTNLPYARKKLTDYSNAKPHRSFQLVMNEEHLPNEVRIAKRRIRIAEVKNQSKAMIANTDCEFVIGLEDDTVFDRLPNFDRLLRPMLENGLSDEEVAFVSGVQIGRWGARIVGAWDIDDPFNPRHALTKLPPTDGLKGYESISAGGWYGYATPRHYYLDHEYHSASTQPWGPDINYGLWLRQQNKKCLIDWNTEFGHKDYNRIAYPETYPLTQVLYTKDVKTGKWDRRDTDQAS